MNSYKLRTTPPHLRFKLKTISIIILKNTQIKTVMKLNLHTKSLYLATEILENYNFIELFSRQKKTRELELLCCIVC